MRSVVLAFAVGGDCGLRDLFQWFAFIQWYESRDHHDYLVGEGKTC